MRFEKGHKESTRRRIVEVAARRFRHDGAAASGLAGIMTEAGLTNGAFYAHFDSKEALVKEAMVSALTHQREILEKALNDQVGLESIIRSYLNVDHMLRRETGCPSAALLPELARQPEPTREAYEVELRKYTDSLASGLPSSSSSLARNKARAIFALMVGTLQIARAVSDPSQAAALLEGGVQAALTLAKS
ncbi:TetR family transcriptional regulator [Rhizobium sp. ERR 922]|uniref:TetR family transcriptional regulator n=1 Tax=Rhizobium TaxID=379 RepID=UPI000DE09104|nr:MULTISPECIES: TetR family transcriptional regulator [Rhizobium]TWB46208.1 TetR family transcriptional regulator [Rhizobium sp. ERR 922]TWB90790.1 TetR family transcriptional regulator [Rhizobium sp. ERR 942]GES46003.1 TetR family transcriptional regulator [Rhizobium dioscoreae]